MSTSAQENKEFYRDKAGYKRQPVKSKTHGTLLCDNLPVVINRPYFVLQMEKKTNYAHIFPKTRLKIVAMIEPA